MTKCDFNNKILMKIKASEYQANKQITTRLQSL